MSTNKTNNIIKAASLVGLVELFKITACMLEIAYRRRKTGGLISEIREEIIGKPKETMMLLVANLEAVVYQVCTGAYTLARQWSKLTALRLDKSPRKQKWAITFRDDCDLNFVSSIRDPCPAQSVSRAHFSPSAPLVLREFSAKRCSKVEGKATAILKDILLLMLWDSSNMSVRNVQLGVPGFVFGIAGVLLTDYTKVTNDGFFQYADNIAKVSLNLRFHSSSKESMHADYCHWNIIGRIHRCFDVHLRLRSDNQFLLGRICPAPKPVV
eukprot:756999-Hanusia_phi.AAC.7